QVDTATRRSPESRSSTKSLLQCYSSSPPFVGTFVGLWSYCIAEFQRRTRQMPIARGRPRGVSITIAAHAQIWIPEIMIILASIGFILLGRYFARHNQR